MQLDTITLMIAGSFVAAIGGVMLIVGHYQLREGRALILWSVASFGYSVGIALFAVGAASGSMIAGAIGGQLSTAVIVLVWVGARDFNQRQQSWLLLALAPIGSFWPLLVPQLAEVSLLMANFAVSAAYLLATAFEIVRGRGENLKARWPLAAFFILHASFFVSGIVDGFTGHLVAGLKMAALETMFSYIQFESLIYSIGATTFMLLLCKERKEQRAIMAAGNDSLTGIAGRGALLDSGERLLNRCLHEGRSFSLIMFDLDRFKWINDTFGHATGEEVIRTFARTTQSILRPNDLFGR